MCTEKNENKLLFFFYLFIDQFWREEESYVQTVHKQNPVEWRTVIPRNSLYLAPKKSIKNLNII